MRNPLGPRCNLWKIANAEASSRQWSRRDGTFQELRVTVGWLSKFQVWHTRYTALETVLCLGRVRWSYNIVRQRLKDIKTVYLTICIYLIRSLWIEV